MSEQGFEMPKDLSEASLSEFVKRPRTVAAEPPRYTPPAYPGNDPVNQIKAQLKLLTHRQMRDMCKALGTDPPRHIVAGVDDNFFVTEQPVTVQGARVNLRANAKARCSSTGKRDQSSPARIRVRSLISGLESPATSSSISQWPMQ